FFLPTLPSLFLLSSSSSPFSATFLPPQILLLHLHHGDGGSAACRRRRRSTLSPSPTPPDLCKIKTRARSPELVSGEARVATNEEYEKVQDWSCVNGGGVLIIVVTVVG
ncbi:hypothetical protein LINGRAPRIM_LOCUS32, partial [Linum grandiflorum]